VEEVNQYLQHVQNNPELDEFPMNNLPIRTQIAESEIAYYKIRHTNPVLVEVDMDFYHSLPPVQVLLGEMTRLESLAMRLEANNIKTTTTITPTMTATHTAARPQPKNCTGNNTVAATTTSTTAITTPKPTVGQTHHQNRTEKDTAGTPATTNNNNNSNNNDNPVKTDDSHIPGPSDYLLEQQKAAAEVEQ